MSGEEAYAAVMEHLRARRERKAGKAVRTQIHHQLAPPSKAMEIPLSPVPLRWVDNPAKREALPSLDAELRRGLRRSIDAAKRVMLVGRDNPLNGVGVGLRR